uniref:YgiT-type zinc finger domain-containing protein n=1 Tax=Candidatus Kentrum eta TaxID=2126337 RepID=A0A450UGH6_9GAMM|nr:MAG: YgiT-type zinc finger domain-containing protein [Candidatus Kentron sp. H]VFJ92699.1 MAG: YgiT-type zinc finger domain-containing protein [Candidatus Kentron sp. H]VFJ99508.1 MAG: YgiT-type zinc finger domain-containing protein [Candidatus Kentron sp. H]
MTGSDTPCPLCHGGQTQPDTTPFTLDLGFGVVVVRGVPAQVCDLRGADWIEENVTGKLAAIVEQARGEKPEVKVANWRDEVGFEY